MLSNDSTSFLASEDAIEELPRLFLRRGTEGGVSSPSTPKVESSVMLARDDMVLESDDMMKIMYRNDLYSKQFLGKHASRR